LLALVIAAATGIWQRERIWIWYCAERLERASVEERIEWAGMLAEAGEPALPTLFNLLRHDDPTVCESARWAIETMTSHWPADDPRRLAFSQSFFDAEPRLSTPGRSAALDLLPMVLVDGSPETSRRAREMIASSARSESIAIRIQSVAVALRPDVDALEAIVPLLQDSAPEVRQAAVLALGPVREGKPPAIADDGLLRCLHDSDPKVRDLAEMGLRSRGRTARDIRLGRRYAAPDAAERQRLLIDLAEEEELDVAVWLERLTRDSDPAVRAGAARLAAERRADLHGRLEEMSRTDPDGTVRRITAYYFRRLSKSN
jgi:HEAT repeat protein